MPELLEQYQVPTEKLLVLARSGIFNERSAKVVIDIDGDGNIQKIKIERTAFIRKSDLQKREKRSIVGL